MAQIDETIRRMQELAHYKSEGNAPVRCTSLESIKEGVDGKVYGIVHEEGSYFVKVANKQETRALVAEDFDFIGGFANRGKHKYESFTSAVKNRDLFLQEMRNSRGSNAIIIESTNPSYKEQLVTEATGDMATSIARMRQIMANVKVIEEGYTVTPVGKEIGKPGDGEPFGTKNAEANQYDEKTGFEITPKQPKETGEPGEKGKGDDLTQVKNVENGEKPMTEGKDDEFTVEPVDNSGDTQTDTSADITGDTVTTDSGVTISGDTKDEKCCDGDALKQILDRLDAIEKKVDELPFKNDEPLIPDGDSGETKPEDASGVTVDDAASVAGIDTTGDTEGNASGGTPANDGDINLGGDDDENNTVKDESCLHEDENLEDRFPWLKEEGSGEITGE